MKLIIRDDEGTELEIDFVRDVLTRVPPQGVNSHELVMKALEGIEVGEYRSMLLRDLMQEEVKGYVLEHCCPCNLCDRMLLIDKLEEFDGEMRCPACYGKPGLYPTTGGNRRKNG